MIITNNNMVIDLSLELANELVSINASSLSSADISQVECLLLDHLGVCIRGSSLPWMQNLISWGSKLDGSGKAHIFGSEYYVPARIAALINATGAHGMELDDTHDTSVSHPGAIVIATALAIGSTMDSNSGDILSAIVTGYETIGRVGQATGAADIIEHGFHPTALFGGFGAVTTAARLYNLSPDRLSRAWGLMLSMAGGSMQFSQDPEGTTVKRLHAGYTAHNGIMAAEFSRIALDGPSQAFDGRYGLCNIFGKEPRIDFLKKDKEKPLEIHQISIKPYPCCRLFHSTIDALREATNNFNIPPEDIRKIKVGGPSILIDQHMMLRPTSVMAAQYSLPFTLGASLISGPNDYEAFEENNLDNQYILDLADKVTANVDFELNKQFPEHFGSWVELELKGNQSERITVLDSHGTPEHPMTIDDISVKINSLLRPLSDRPLTENIKNKIKQFVSEPSSSVSTFVKQINKI